MGRLVLICYEAGLSRPATVPIIRQHVSATLPLNRSIWSETEFVRLWCLGGLSTAMMWLEVLAASLFTFQATGSGWAVAVVSAARAAPLLLFGAAAGVLCDRYDRRYVVMGGSLLSLAAAATLVLLASAALLRPWHLAVAAFVSGSAYATEFPARRRMVAESAGPGRLDAAVAADSLTSYAARCGGPLLGGLVFQRLGMPGAFAISCGCNLVALVLASALPSSQVQAVAATRDPANLGAALSFAWRSPVLLCLLAVTVTMNLCGYSYATLIAPIAQRALGLDATLTGVLASAEPGGALCGGLLLMRAAPRRSRLGWLMGGVAILACGLLAAAGLGAASFGWPAVCLALAAGGFGSAVYTNMQTSLVLAETPPSMRSRIMGVLTVCIGSWPFGMLLAGGLAAGFAATRALAALAACALALLELVLLVARRLL